MRVSKSTYCSYLYEKILKCEKISNSELTDTRCSLGGPGDISVYTVLYLYTLYCFVNIFNVVCPSCFTSQYFAPPRISVCRVRFLIFLLQTYSTPNIHFTFSVFPA